MSHNGLYSFALEDLTELQKTQDTPGINFIVQIDSYQGARRYKADRQGLHLLAFLGDVNSGSSEALRNFGIWAAERYPSKYNALVLWDHGDGWSKGGKYIGYDEQNLDYLSVSQGELKEAVRDIVVKLGKPLDIIAMDACGMQMAEVLMEFQGLSRFAVGSQAMFPLSGLPYDMVFKDIGDLSPENLAIQIVNSCRVEYSSDPGVTFSAVDVDKLTAWSEECGSFVNEVSRSGIAGTIDAQSMADSVQRYSPFDSYDLFDVLSYFSDHIGGALSDRAIVLKNSLLECIIAEFHNYGGYQKSKGLSVWLSASDYGLKSRIDDYWRLNWTKRSDWDVFLCSIIGIPDVSTPMVQGLVVNQTENNGRRISWKAGYDQSRIATYQARRIQQTGCSFFDNGEFTEPKQFILSGFSLSGFNSGYLSDHAYYSTNGIITTATPIDVESNSGIGWMMKAQRGYCYLQVSIDTLQGWDTLARYTGYFDTTWKYYYCELPPGLNWVRWSWSTEWLGWAYLDDINVPIYSKDSTVIAQTTDTFLTVTQQLQPVSEYQVRAIDGKGNPSYWSRPVTVNTGKTVKNLLWPNPSSGQVNWLVSDKILTPPELTVYNLLGQKVATPSMVDREYLSADGSYSYHFKWDAKERTSISVSGGVYIYKISTSGASFFGRFILLK